LPVYTRLIDSPEPIREKVFEHIDDFVAGLPPDLGWMTFLGLDKAWELDTLGHWRTREAVALHLPAFFTLFVKQDRDLSPVLSMTQAALLDKFAAVREAAIKSIPKSYESLNGTKFEHPFREMILSLATASAYRRRVTFTRCLREFVRPPPNREAFERFFIPTLPRMRQDVVDVRIALAQIVGDLFIVKAYYHDTPNVPESICQLVRDLAEDESCDVRDTVRHIDLDSLGKGKGPQVVKKEAEADTLPDRAHTAERTDHHTESLPRKDYDPEATPHATAAELLARAPDPFDSSFEREIHKDDDDTPK
jgi:serine/threonine-protein phosphatase 4 regulatory subunit 1